MAVAKPKLGPMQWIVPTGEGWRFRCTECKKVVDSVYILKEEYLCSQCKRDRDEGR